MRSRRFVRSILISLPLLLTTFGHGAAELSATTASQVVAEAEAGNACGLLMDEARQARLPSRVLLASLPDPIETVYAREFDSIFEAIVRAAAQAGYEMQQTCLPWADERDPQRYEREPGIAVLRAHPGPACPKGDCLLVLLLIGERPQDGVRSAVVHEAFRIAAAQVPDRDVEIVGPTFSSTAESLTRALASWRSNEAAAGRLVRIRSGSTTDPQVEAQLQTVGADFRSLAVSHDDLQSCVWNRVVPERLGLDVRWAMPGDQRTARDHPCAPRGSGSANRHIALLVERSAYGRQFRGDGFRLVHFTPHLPFLRAAYASRGSAGAVDGEVADEHTTRLDLSLARSVAEGLPFFDREGTIVSQDLVLRSTLQRLARLKVQVVGIVATNVMDKIFLAEMVRDQVPNARLVTFEGDILLSHPAALRATVGTLVASSHPLLAPAPGTASLEDLPVQFDFDAAQGAYHAAGELLTGRRGADPTLWMNVVGRGGLYPLERIALAPQPAPSDTPPAMPRAERRLPNAWLLLVLLATVGVASIFAAAIAQLRRRRSHLFGVIPCTLIRPVSLARGGSALHALLALLPLVVGLPYLILLMPLGLYWTFDGGNLAIMAVVASALVVGLFLVACLASTFLYLFGLLFLRTVLHLAALGQRGERRRRRAFQAVVPLGAVIAVTVVAYHTAERWQDAVRLDEDALMTLERSLSLSNGVSPVLPALILGIVVTGWLALALYRQRCAESLPEAEEIDHLDREIRQPIDCLRDSIAPVNFQLRASWGWWLVLGLIPFLYIGLFFLDLESWPVRGIEGSSFEESINLLLLAAAVLAIASGLSLHNGWRALRALLLRVDRLGIGWPELKAALQADYAAAGESLDEATRTVETRLSNLRAQVDAEPAPDLPERLDDRPAVCWARVFAWMASTQQEPDNPVHGAARAFFVAGTALLVRQAYLQLIHLRTFLTCSLLGLVLALISYPFEPERLLRLYAAILVTAGAALSATILLQARKAARWNFLVHPDSRFEGFGDLTARLAFHAGLPALGLVAGRFPQLGGPLLQWIEQLARPFA